MLDATGAERLADELSAATRVRTRVVVTTAAGRRPVIDIDALAAALGERAEVVLVLLAFRPPDQVRPGSVPLSADTGQVHPTSGRSGPLRLAATPAERHRVLAALIADVERLDATTPRHRRSDGQAAVAPGQGWSSGPGRHRPLAPARARPTTGPDETAFRVSVHRAWARRFAPDDDALLPVPPPYGFGARFLPSLAEFGSADLTPALTELVVDLLRAAGPSPTAVPRPGSVVWLEHSRPAGRLQLDSLAPVGAPSLS